MGCFARRTHAPGTPSPVHCMTRAPHALSPANRQCTRQTHKPAHERTRIWGGGGLGGGGGIGGSLANILLNPPSACSAALAHLFQRLDTVYNVPNSKSHRNLVELPVRRLKSLRIADLNGTNRDSVGVSPTQTHAEMKKRH